MQMEVAGIPVEVTRKDIRTLRLTVVPPEGAVRLSVPRRLAEADIRRFLLGHADWIAVRREAMAARPRQPEPRFVSGETLTLWGQAYPLRVAPCRRGGRLSLEDGTAVLSVGETSTVQQRERIVNEWYRGLLKSRIEARLPAWEAAMGLHCSGWQTKNMKTRWGTCNTRTGKLWFSLQLAKYPPACLDYVLVHELAHLRVRNHGAAFTALLDGVLPDWPARKRLLDDGTPLAAAQ